MAPYSAPGDTPHIHSFPHQGRIESDKKNKKEECLGNRDCEIINIKGAPRSKKRKRVFIVSLAKNHKSRRTTKTADHKINERKRDHTKSHRVKIKKRLQIREWT